MGGHVLAHASTTRVMLKKGKGEQRIAKVRPPYHPRSLLMLPLPASLTLFLSSHTCDSSSSLSAQIFDSPLMPEDEATFAIAKGGIVDI